MPCILLSNEQFVFKKNVYVVNPLDSAVSFIILKTFKLKF